MSLGLILVVVGAILAVVIFVCSAHVQRLSDEGQFGTTITTS